MSLPRRPEWLSYPEPTALPRCPEDQRYVGCSDLMSMCQFLQHFRQQKPRSRATQPTMVKEPKSSLSSTASWFSVMSSSQLSARSPASRVYYCVLRCPLQAVEATTPQTRCSYCVRNLDISGGAHSRLNGPRDS